jgi:hypothetical protein
LPSIFIPNLYYPFASRIPNLQALSLAIQRTAKVERLSLSQEAQPRLQLTRDEEEKVLMALQFNSRLAMPHLPSRLEETSCFSLVTVLMTIDGMVVMAEILN